MTSNLSPRVVVAMSGGVDSSVAAALLVEQGYRVVGMMLRLWSEEGEEAYNRCCAPQAVEEARRIAGGLRIPFYVIDAREIFRKVVVGDFLEGYSRGETPNPCLVCNRQIRWRFLLDQALAVGGSYLATGHYARLVKEDDGCVRLLKAVDGMKDQSYVLSGLTQSQLAQTILPLGSMIKTEVRERARNLGLSVADKPDSQDLCFLGNGDYRDFLRRQSNIDLKAGEIIDQDGRVLGTHEGLALYTIGQRKGLGIIAHEPHYVLSKNQETNQLVVGKASELGTCEFRVCEINWICPAEVDVINVDVKIRYRAQLAKASIRIDSGNCARVILEQPLRDITPGQQAVFYQGDICLGGGRIVA